MAERVTNLAIDELSRSRLAVWAGTAALMLLPVLAIRDLDELASDPGDLVFLSILLAGVGLAYEVATRVPPRRAYRAGIGLAVATSLISGWINLAVGIIGSEDNPANWMYAGVIGIAVAGSLLGRFTPVAMSRSMTAAAVGQGLTFLVALVAGLGFTGPITVFFTSLWLLSAFLFRKAAVWDRFDQRAAPKPGRSRPRQAASTPE